MRKSDDRETHPPPPRSAKLIGDIATGQVEDINEDGKNAGAPNLGRLGGAARARALSPERKTEIAKKAAATGVVKMTINVVKIGNFDCRHR